MRRAPLALVVALRGRSVRVWVHLGAGRLRVDGGHDALAGGGTEAEYMADGGGEQQSAGDGRVWCEGWRTAKRRGRERSAASVQQSAGQGARAHNSSHAAQSQGRHTAAGMQRRGREARARASRAKSKCVWEQEQEQRKGSRWREAGGEAHPSLARRPAGPFAPGVGAATKKAGRGLGWASCCCDKASKGRKQEARLRGRRSAMSAANHALPGRGPDEGRPWEGHGSGLDLRLLP